jgi:hypothetical protein
MLKRLSDGEPMVLKKWDPGSKKHVVQKKLARFILGPLPLDWFEAASSLGHGPLAAGLTIWRVYGMTKRDTMTLSSADLRHMGISKIAKSRALRALERAKLIRVKREPGRGAVITIRQ